MNISTPTEAIDLIDKRGIKQIKLATTDIDGVLRGKYINREKFVSILENGIGFCDVIFGWDCNDELYEKDSITGWKDAYPDALGHIDISTCRELPLEENTILFWLTLKKAENTVMSVQELF